MIPKDPVMLLSYVNTQLRDNYISLEDMCHSLDIEEEEIKTTLRSINYEYDKDSNKFI